MLNNLDQAKTDNERSKNKEKLSCPNKMATHFRTFLEEHKVRQGEPFTHTSKGAWKMIDNSRRCVWEPGSYYIGSDDIEEFWTLYCNLITKKIFPTVTERPTPVGKPIGPLRVDFDLKAPIITGLKRQYSPEILKKIIAIYQAEITTIIDPTEFEDKMLWCLVLEKPRPRKEKDMEYGTIVKDGFHLHFPHFICDAWTQDHYLRDRVTRRMIDEKIWIGVKLIDSINTLIDSQMAKKMWMMYGSTNYKNDKSKPYLCTRAYNHEVKNVNLEQVFDDEMQGRKSSVQYYLPRFLSIKGCDQTITLTDQFVIRMPRPRKPVVTKTRSEEDVIADLKRIEEGCLLDLLSTDRLNDRNGWMDIGWTLFNIGQGEDRALQMWIDVSMKSSRFIDGECETEWNKMEMRGKTVASLIKMVQEDNPAEYREWKESQIDHWIDQSLLDKKPTECDLAMVVYRMYEGRFICARSKKDVWFEFRNHRWFELDDGHTLKLLLCTEIKDEYDRYSSKLMDWRRDAEDEVDRKRYETKISRCFAICHWLKTTAAHEKIVKACKLRMYDGDFFDKLDRDPLLLGCENGVIDLKLNSFRSGRPDDYISCSTRNNWIEYNENDYQVQKLREFLQKIFPDPELRVYHLDFFSSCLEAGNIHKTFLVGTGMGNNGKTKMFKMTEFAFGEYCVKFQPETLIAGRGQAGGPRSDLIRSKTARVGLVDEISEMEKINIGALKQITGGDSVSARDLFQTGKEQRDIQPRFTLIMQCNVPPKIPGQDKATWERVRVLDFESEFVKPKDLDENHVPDNESEQMRMKKFVADLTLNDNWLQEMAPVLLWMLVKNFPKYKARGIKEPVKVRESTDSYQLQNDIYRQFIKKHIEQSDEKGENVLVTESYKLFRSWYRQNHPSYAKDKNSQIDTYTFIRQISKRLGKVTLRGRTEMWEGYKIIDCDDDDPKDFFEKK